ncbi:MAG: ATP-binding protein [Polyangiales bacterium]
MSRFERKILFVIGLTVVLTLGGAIFFAQGALREVYQVGVNEGFGQELRAGVEARRGQLMALRDGSEQVADAVAWAVESELLRRQTLGDVEALLAGLIERYPGVRTIELFQRDDLLAVASGEPATLPEAVRATVRTREIQAHRRLYRVAVEVTVPETYFERMQRAGEAAEVYSRLQRQSASVSDVYVWVFGVLVFLVIVVAFLIGAVASRRVTRRVTVLAEASRRVGAGDFTVTLPTVANDEVTELTQAFNDMVRDLRDSRTRIEYLQRISAWQDFARRLAHEIKNPLTPIQLAAQELDDTYEGDDAEYREKLEHARAIIEEEVATLRRLVGEFSAFAKLPRADLSEAELSDLVHSIEDSVPAMLEDIGIDGPAPVEVRVDRATKPMHVRMDPMMLRRGIDNILRNAIQAVYAINPTGGGHVFVRAYPLDGCAFIEIRDNGPGIPADDRERVFDPYYTTKTEGTGLGLPIVKKVVLEHGGEVTLDAAPEGGARFRIELPLVDAP